MNQEGKVYIKWLVEESCSKINQQIRPKVSIYIKVIFKLEDIKPKDSIVSCNVS